MNLQETMDQLRDNIRAGFPVIYIISHEEHRVLNYLAKVFRAIKAEKRGKHFLRWYEGIGLEEIMNLEPYDDVDNLNWLTAKGLSTTETQLRAQPDARADNILKSVQRATERTNEALSDSIVVIFDIHRKLRDNSGEGSLVRPVRNAADALRKYYDKNQETNTYKTIIVVAPSSNDLSRELEHDVIVIDFPLPEEDELRLTLEKMLERGVLKFADRISEKAIESLGGKNATVVDYKGRLIELIAGAGRGLTLESFKLGLQMIGVSGEPLAEHHIEAMLHLKSKVINNPALQYYPHVNVELGGLENIKTWIRDRKSAVVSAEVRDKYHLPAPKGVLLCGASGGGKSQLAKLIATEFNLALLRLDVGALFGMYMGQSEERTRRALQIAEVLAPIVLWIDELDKAFSGIGDNGDNGVSARVLGHFLTWLAEKQDSVFVVATANDYKTLLERFPEFGRKGRFDEIFWVPLPSREERAAIFRIYLQKHLEEEYLNIAFENAPRILPNINLNDMPYDESSFEQLIWILSHNNVSQNMTGAEIEYAVNEALYETYKLSQKNDSTRLSAEIIIEVVKKASERCVYGIGTTALSNLNTLQADALDVRKWLPASAAGIEEGLAV